MKSSARLTLLLAAVVMLVGGGNPKPSQAAAPPMPQFVEKNGKWAFMVDGEPFIMLGAQANNSSNYPVALGKVWPVLEKMGANTLEIPVAWEQIEPKEGQFDFSYVDTLLDQARQHKLRLVLLWFGTWKNTGPAYTPAWVKLDNRRFPRMIDAKGKTVYALSPFGEETLKADSKAFAALMGHLKSVDPQRTVILMQVENETGTYGTVRDYAPLAQKVFDAPVPAALVQKLGKTPGTWQQVFGTDADESFHAWAIASYVNKVAEAGQAVYALPMYVNAALRDPFKYQAPNTYAAGGPTWNVLDIWKAAAPAIAGEEPDIYSSTFAEVMGQISRYHRPDNPFFVPEFGNRPWFARFFFAVLGNQALGFAPFGMDYTGYANYPLGALRVNDEIIAPFALNYSIVAPMMREWAKISFEKPIWGVAEPDDRASQTQTLGRWLLTVDYQQWQFGPVDKTHKNGVPPGAEEPSGGVLVAQLGPDEFLVTGVHARVSFGLADKQSKLQTQFDRVEEGHYANGQWVMDRVWNGDQIDWGLNFTTVPQVLRVRLGTF